MNETKSISPWPALLALTGLNLFNYLDRFLLPAMASPVQRELGIDDEQFGRLTTAFMLGYFLTAPFFGLLGDRAPRKWLIAFGVFVWSVGTMLSGLAHGFVALIVFRVIVGVGEASYGTLSPSWLADLYPLRRRNNVLAFFSLAIPVGAALAFKFGGWMATSYDWHRAFLWAGAPGLLLAVAVLALKEPARGASEAAEEAGGGPVPAPAPGGGLRSYARLGQFPCYLLVVAGYTAYTFAMGGFVNWAAQFLERVHGMELKAADNFFGLALVGTGISATLLGGLAATAWQRRSPAGSAWLLGLSALAAVPAVFAAFMLQDLAAAKAALVVAMFLLFLSTGPVNAVILGTVPATMRASAMAACIFTIHLFGDLWSPWLVGAVSKEFGNLQAAVVWTLPPAIILCAAFWLWLALRMRREKAQAAGVPHD